MLKVELRSLEHEDLQLDEKGEAPALGIELSPEFCTEPISVHCQLSKGGDLISAKGWVEGKMLLTCDRCLKEFASPYKSYFEVLYSPAPEQQECGEDVDEDAPDGAMETVYFEGDMLDIADQIRQTVLLSVPMRVLCSEKCKGLCVGCGRDLNVESCTCGEPPQDSRWSALKKWKAG